MGDSMAMARGLLMLMPSLLLIPTTMVDTMDMVWVTMVAMDTMAWDMSMARGLLMLMLIPTTMVDSMDMVWATMVATVLDTMDWDMSMARGLLMLMPSLLLIPTMAMDMVLDMVDTMAMDMVWDTVDTMAMDMVWDTVDTTGDKSSHQQGYLNIHQDLSVNHQLLCQQKNGLFQFEFHPPPVLPVSVLPA